MWTIFHNLSSEPNLFLPVSPEFVAALAHAISFGSDFTKAKSLDVTSALAQIRDFKVLDLVCLCLLCKVSLLEFGAVGPVVETVSSDDLELQIQVPIDCGMLPNSEGCKYMHKIVFQQYCARWLGKFWSCART